MVYVPVILALTAGDQGNCGVIHHGSATIEEIVVQPQYDHSNSGVIGRGSTSDPGNLPCEWWDFVIRS